MSPTTTSATNVLAIMQQNITIARNISYFLIFSQSFQNTRLARLDPITLSMHRSYSLNSVCSKFISKNQSPNFRSFNFYYKSSKTRNLTSSTLACIRLDHSATHVSLISGLSIGKWVTVSKMLNISLHNFLISHPKYMLWVLKRTVSMRRFLLAPKTYDNTEG